MTIREEYSKLIRQALQTTNPFLIRSETGSLIHYENAKECYQLVMMALFAEFPAGFVDIAYFMMKYQRATPKLINSILKYKDYSFVRMWKDDIDRYYTLHLIFEKLLQVSGCNFDEVAFGDAIKALDSFLKKQGVVGTLSKLNNINVI